MFNKTIVGSICGGRVQTQAGDKKVLSHIPQCRYIMSVMLLNTQVNIGIIHSNQGQYFEILLYFKIDDIFVPDFKCSNKTVRRQYILNQVLKARINILVLYHHHHNAKTFVAIVSSDRSSLRYNTPLPCRKYLSYTILASSLGPTLQHYDGHYKPL